MMRKYLQAPVLPRRRPHRGIGLFAVALGAALIACLPAAAATELPAAVRTSLAQHDVPPEAVSILIRDADTGDDRLRWNAETPRNPASVMKLFTTYAALTDLGPAHTWETRVYADGPVRDGRLEGDLWLVGDGDPFLTARDFWQILGTIQRRGIQQITGDLVLDTSRFAPVQRDPAAFDDRPRRAYNQPPNALLVNFNAIEYEINSPRTADGIRVSAFPPLAGLAVNNQLNATPDAWCGSHRWQVDYDFRETPDGPRAQLAGPVAPDCGHVHLRRTGPPVGDYVHGLFRSLWQHWRGRFAGTWRRGEWSGDGDPLVRHESDALAAVVRLINKYSNNVMTRQLALTLAAERRGAPASEAQGRSVVRAILAEEGITSPRFNLDEVAGLSRENRVSADHVAQLLATARTSLVAPEFMASLPIAGVDGNLRTRLSDGEVTGRARMKTGMIDDVSAIAGYLRTADNRERIVVVLINHDDVHRGAGRAIQDAIVRWAHG